MDFGADFKDFLGSFMPKIDGEILGGDCFGYYDEDHKKKMQELLDKDERYLYIIERRCGIDPYEDDFYGPDNDIRIVNDGHFAIRGNLKDKLEEYRKKVYDIIDDVYAHQKDTKIEAELDGEDELLD